MNGSSVVDWLLGLGLQAPLSTRSEGAWFPEKVRRRGATMTGWFTPSGEKDVNEI
jgi:hypothetical protein